MEHQSDQPAHISIEITCAFPQHQFLEKLQVTAGTTIAQAIAQSGIEKFLSDQNCTINTIRFVGIFGKRATMQTVLQANDRVEIYRPLIIDPKEKRRIRSIDQPKR